jgi:hypothetical protein
MWSGTLISRTIKQEENEPCFHLRYEQWLCHQFQAKDDMTAIVQTVYFMQETKDISESLIHPSRQHAEPDIMLQPLQYP